MEENRFFSVIIITRDVHRRTGVRLRFLECLLTIYFLYVSTISCGRCGMKKQEAGLAPLDTIAEYAECQHVLFRKNSQFCCLINETMPKYKKFQ